LCLHFNFIFVAKQSHIIVSILTIANNKNKKTVHGYYGVGYVSFFDAWLFTAKMQKYKNKKYFVNRTNDMYCTSV